MKKNNKEEAKKLFEEKGYVVLEEYKDCHTPILLEKDGYKFRLDKNHLDTTKNPVLFGKRCEFYKENIALYISRVNTSIKFIDVEVVRKSGKVRTLVKMECSCGKEFCKTWEHIYSDNKHLLCSKCANKIGCESRKRNSHKKYLKNIEKRGYALIDPKSILRPSKYVEVVQNSTGYRGFIYPNNQKEMIVFSIYVNKSNYIYNLNVYAKNSGIPTRALGFANETDKWEDQKVIFRCQCGEEFETTAYSFKGNKLYCPKCSNKMSNYEITIKAFLDENGIEYKQEFWFNSCRDVYPLPFDFHINCNDGLIEIDGEQHFKPINFGYSTEEEAIRRYNTLIEHDRIKNEFCKKNNIPLLRISYKDMKENAYREKILKFIQTA